ncbi:hypothetical protein B0H19DRAFT_1382556 [Mycena capillaripes]|nr:hypothetical protein B0H19DRAFT_1382556 [Mycena capillaripes]
MHPSDLAGIIGATRLYRLRADFLMTGILTSFSLASASLAQSLCSAHALPVTAAWWAEAAAGAPKHAPRFDIWCPELYALHAEGTLISLGRIEGHKLHECPQPTICVACGVERRQRRDLDRPIPTLLESLHLPS